MRKIVGRLKVFKKKSANLGTEEGGVQWWGDRDTERKEGKMR